jgi:serine/threonine protein kinase
LILCISKYTNAIDIWAVGCIIAEIITRDPLFQGKSEGDQLFKIFEVLGSPTDKDFEMLAKFVPYDKKIFHEFKRYQK